MSTTQSYASTAFAGIVCLGALLCFGINHSIAVRNRQALSQLRKYQAREKTIQRISITPFPPMESVHIPVVTYHYVETESPNDVIKRKLTTNPIEFEREIKVLLDAGYTTYFAKDIPRLMRGEIPLSKHNVVLTFDDGYEDFYTIVWPLLKTYRIKGTVFVIPNYLNREGFLTSDQLKELARSEFVEIGAHTMDHVGLGYTNSEIAKFQITQSKKTLEEIIKKPVETFAYPFGSYISDTIEMVKEASFSAAFTTFNSTLIEQKNILAIPRIRSGYLATPRVTETLEQLLKIRAKN